MSLMSFSEACEVYTDKPEIHRKIWDTFSAGTDAYDYLARHRNYIEAGNQAYWSSGGTAGKILGHGNRPFSYFWKLLTEQVEGKEFNFLEIGVYKAQILSLIELLANQQNRKANIVGATILYDVDFGDYNRMPYIEKIYKDFNLSMENTKIIDGSSHTERVINEVKVLGPYDIIYIDGDHSYMGCRNDIENYGPMLKTGGYMVMDDAGTDLQIPPEPRMGDPNHIYPGIEAVTSAVKDTLDKDSNYKHLFSVGHLRVYKKHGN